MKYQWTDDEYRVVHVIDDDNKSRKSMLVVGRDHIIDGDFEAFQEWVSNGNVVGAVNELIL